MLSPVRVAVLGATGAVGKEFLRLFESRGLPIAELRLLASERSAGKVMQFAGKSVTVEAVQDSSFDGIDVAFFSAGATRSREFAEAATSRGALVIDNSSAFRMDPSVPLVVPEVNPDAVPAGCKLISNPNCTAAILLMAVHPLRKLGTIKRIIVSTYQSASGAGAAAMEELAEQTRDALEGKPLTPRIMPHIYAFNLFSHNTAINAEGDNEEEAKVKEEVRKILALPDLAMNVTCVRVPVMRAHSESVTVEFEDSAPSEDAVRAALEAAPGVRLVDDRAANHFPMPSEASGQDDVLVGRIRRDASHPSAVSLFIAGDQLLKGAALNAVQIAEHVLSN
ncbi:MAG: aspartate-semialdehyde dehydrogenase [Chthonomonas sp.]|nr:aspartate-semialdehyde dehydrogenase [Chthonomonas sp.]